jgi:hypothetical protein
MIQFQYEGKATHEQREAAKQFFLNKLGVFRDEFDEKNGFVTVDFNSPPDDPDRFKFTVAQQYNLSDFIMRFNEHYGDNQLQHP